MDYEPYFADRETEARRLSGFFKATQGFSIIPEIKTWASLSPGLKLGHICPSTRLKNHIKLTHTYTPRKAFLQEVRKEW